MKTGLVIGKFMPFHYGHVKLIEFAKKHCSCVIVLVCSSVREPITGTVRLDWVTRFFKNIPSVVVRHFEYDESILPGTSVSSKENSILWGDVLKASFPQVTAVFTSEKYGDYLADHMNIRHLAFDISRSIISVSGSQIRADPFKYWDYLPEIVKPFFVKKICISGSESTGKSTLAKSLALNFETEYVPEMARDMVSHTDDCSFEDLHKIAELHAKTIQLKIQQANKILFCDTDINITKSYSRFLFAKELKVESWIEEANTFDMHLFLETDCPFIQDGTRISESEREKLSMFHKEQLNKAGVDFISLAGDWQMRFNRAKEITISQFFTQ